MELNSLPKEQYGIVLIPFLIIFFILSIQLGFLQKTLALRGKIDSELNIILNQRAELHDESVKFLRRESNSNAKVTNSVGSMGTVTKLNLINKLNPSILIFTQNNSPQINWKKMEDFNRIFPNIKENSNPRLTAENLIVDQSSLIPAMVVEIKNTLKISPAHDNFFLGITGSLVAKDVILEDINKISNLRKTVFIITAGEIKVENIDVKPRHATLILISTSSKVKITNESVAACECSHSRQFSCYTISHNPVRSLGCEITIPVEIIARQRVLGSTIID